MDFAAVLCAELGITRAHVENIIKLIDEGDTIPFIARYRKELTGGTDDQLLRRFAERLEYLRGLDKRRAEILASIEAQGKLTDELTAAVGRAATLAELEDIYRPYKQKRRTRGSVARERGLEPLAALLFAQKLRRGALTELAEPYVNAEKGVPSAQDALDGASDIIAEDISDMAIIRKSLRELLSRRGTLETKAVEPKDGVPDEEKQRTYAMYASYSEPLRTLAPHRTLAVNRGEREGALKVSITADRTDMLATVFREVIEPGSVSTEFVRAAATDAFDRLIFPAVERELRGGLTDAANDRAIGTFCQNLRPLLMQPPLRGRVVMGLDPGYRTGCKVAVTDGTGKVLSTGVIYPAPPHNKKAEARQIVLSLIKKYGVTAIAIGNGTASRETEEFASDTIKGLDGVSYMVVSEAGASVYSASPLGAEEFPEYDVSLRSAVSIARRLQDPLAELVKIEPASIGVGQYQHDMPPARLSEALDGVVEACVNEVGADLNTASPSLLRRVSGLSAATAKAIVARRDGEGPFASRKELLKVPKLGPKTYQQCAGFLRVPGSAEPLDNTSVHPESYDAARKLLAGCGCTAAELKAGKLGGLREKAEKLGMAALASAAGVGEPTAADIVAALEKPGRDPRDELPPPLMRASATDGSDLKPGMRLVGTVRNVTDFGAFVDVGVHKDGLVHISELSTRFVRHPSEVVSVGDVVSVTVKSVDRGRLSLSMAEPPKE